MTEETPKMGKPKNNRNLIIVGIIGVFAGIILCAIIMISVMPSMMIVTKECTLSFDETVAALEKRIPEQGWAIQGGKPIDMNKSMSAHNVEFAPRVKLIKLCKPEYAKSVLTTDRYVSCLMPCTMAVWEGDDEKVYLSEMNMSLMAKLFGGNIRKIMGGKVVQDEEKMLEGLLK